MSRALRDDGHEVRQSDLDLGRSDARFLLQQLQPDDDSKEHDKADKDKDDDKDKDSKENEKDGKEHEKDGKEHGKDGKEDSKEHGKEKTEAVGGKETFKEATENSEKIQEKVGEVKAATDHAQKESQAVDKDFSKYDSKLKKLTEMLDQVSQKSFRWQKELMNGLAESEGEKYSPLANAEGILRHGQRAMGGGPSNSSNGTNATNTTL